MPKLDGAGLKCPAPGCSGRLVHVVRRNGWFCQGCDTHYTRAQVRARNRKG